MGGINDYIRIGARMKYIRKKAGRVSQKEMAQKLNISQTAYSNYENENREPPFSIVLKFCKEFNMSIDDILSINLQKPIEKGEEMSYSQISRNDNIVVMVNKINSVGVSNLKRYVNKNHKNQNFSRMMEIIRWSAKYGYAACVVPFGISRQYAEQCLKRYYEYAIEIEKEQNLSSGRSNAKCHSA